MKNKTHRHLLQRVRATRVMMVLLLGAAFHLLSVTHAAGTGKSPPAAAGRGKTLYSDAIDPRRAPRVRELQPPAFEDATAVWGATGRDAKGDIWIGVSANSHGMSAHLLRYSPAADTWQDCGAVVDQLKKAGLHRPGEGQVKIHSKIVAADDGWLYFSSSDEEGELDNGAAPPRWGSHLWRLQPQTCRWQHLLHVPEGLIAVSAGGRYIYALGYWGHVLYQYDIKRKTVRRTQVGSIGGHVSRNFLSDTRGHAYVPRISRRAGGAMVAELVEYDAALEERAATPLPDYLDDFPAEHNHGIMGIANLPDGRLVFTTQRGQLYLIEPRSRGPAVVSAVGALHPDGVSYPGSLFAYGSGLIVSVARRAGRHDWVVYDLAGRTSSAFALDTGDLSDVLLFGSISRDEAGRFYLGGWAKSGHGNPRPLVLQLALTP